MAQVPQVPAKSTYQPNKHNIKQPSNRPAKQPNNRQAEQASSIDTEGAGHQALTRYSGAQMGRLSNGGGAFWGRKILFGQFGHLFGHLFGQLEPAWILSLGSSGSSGTLYNWEG